MNRFIAGLGAGLFASLAVMVTASQVNTNAMTSFSANTTLSADDLNNNNLALIEAINDNAQQLPSGFAAYLLAPGFTKKTFASKDYTGAVSNCVITRSYARSQVGNVVRIVRTQERLDPQDPNAACTGSPAINTFELSSEDYKQVSITRQTLDTGGNPVNETLSLLDPITLLKKGMRVGNNLGGASMTSTSISGASQSVFFTEEIMLLVPSLQIVKTDNSVATYTDCFTMKDTHTSTAFFVSWVCKDVGLVKRISSAGDVWELQSYN